jgi:hypothetical protein
MSLHRLTAGSGYDYLTRQVAALDATEKGHTGLASYYTGFWNRKEMLDRLVVLCPVCGERYLQYDPGRGVSLSGVLLPRMVGVFGRWSLGSERGALWLLSPSPALGIPGSVISGVPLGWCWCGCCSGRWIPVHRRNGELYPFCVTVTDMAGLDLGEACVVSQLGDVALLGTPDSYFLICVVCNEQSPTLIDNHLRLHFSTLLLMFCSLLPRMSTIVLPWAVTPHASGLLP